MSFRIPLGKLTANGILMLSANSVSKGIEPDAFIIKERSWEHYFNSWPSAENRTHFNQPWFAFLHWWLSPV